MPVIVNADNHPFLPNRGSRSAIDGDRAERQDIRPLEILVVNLMADKPSTERQLAKLLGDTPLQVEITFATTNSYFGAIQDGRESKNTPREHILGVYKPWDEVKSRNYDGLVVTGYNALQETVRAEAFWPEVEEVLDWSKTHVTSSMFMCWGAKAALDYFHGVESVKGETKRFGLFAHAKGNDSTRIARGINDVFMAPVSRWKTPRRDQILANPGLEIVADSPDGGPNFIVEPYQHPDLQKLFCRALYVVAHPEYDRDTLAREYHRDISKNPQTPPPENYFINFDQNQFPPQLPPNTWRNAARIYTNWINDLYDDTPYNIDDIPEFNRRAKLLEHNK